MIAPSCRDLHNSSLPAASVPKTRIYDARRGAAEWRQPWATDSFIRLQRLRISYKAVGVRAAEGVTITVAVKPAASVIVGGTLSILIRTGIRWASRTHV